jgi:hypothetical protein
MSFTELENLLIRIKKGDLSDESLARAEVLLGQEQRLPVELRQESLRDDPVATATALLSVLGHDDGFGIDLAAAVAFELSGNSNGLLSAGPMSKAGNRGPEADTLEITNMMVLELEADGLPISDAIIAESGHCDVVEQVMENLGLVEQLPLASAIAALAGTVDVSKSVMAELGEQSLPISEAIHAEAGSVNVVDEVMATVRRDALVPTMRVSDPQPANDRWMHWSALAIAAVTLLSVITLPMLGGSEEVAVQEPRLQFASAAEIVVDDLSYDEEAFVQVIHDTDDDGEQALIIWVDDEAVL